jgi:hypothetical protein
MMYTERDTGVHHVGCQAGWVAMDAGLTAGYRNGWVLIHLAASRPASMERNEGITSTARALSVHQNGRTESAYPT